MSYTMRVSRLFANVSGRNGEIIKYLRTSAFHVNSLIRMNNNSSIIIIITFHKCVNHLRDSLIDNEKTEFDGNSNAHLLRFLGAFHTFSCLEDL